MIAAILPRLSEPSTWAGLLQLILLATGWALNDGDQNTIINACAGISGVALILLREHKPT